MIQYPQPPTKYVQCANGCGAELFNSDYSHRFGVGLSHYRPKADGSYERSYVQVFSTPHSCSHDCAVAVARSHVANLAALPRGTYTPAVHNPSGEQSDETARRNVEYNQDGLLPAKQLPQVDAITGESLVGKDVYIPHVDNSTLGTHYQDVLLQQPAYQGASVADVTLGTGSLENAVKLAQAILDEILLPHHEGKPVQIVQEAPPEDVHHMGKAAGGE